MPRYNNPRKTWQYSMGFKAKAVELSVQDGIQVQQESAATYDVPVSPKIRAQIRPATSANAHLLLKAVELSCENQESIDAALMLRESLFFRRL